MLGHGTPSAGLGRVKRAAGAQLAGTDGSMLCPYPNEDAPVSVALEAD